MDKAEQAKRLRERFGTAEPFTARQIVEVRGANHNWLKDGTLASFDAMHSYDPDRAWVVSFDEAGDPTPTVVPLSSLKAYDGPIAE